MDNFRVTKKTFAKWLEEAVTVSNAALESAHVDELEGISFGDEDGLGLVRRCCALLEDGRTILRDIHGARSFRYLLMFLPLGPSTSLSLWDESLWDGVRGVDEPPSVYLIAGDQLLEEWDEEYRRPVKIPVAEHSGFVALYRCWRSRDDLQNSSEFARGIYIIVDFREPSPSGA